MAKQGNVDFDSDSEDEKSPKSPRTRRPGIIIDFNNKKSVHHDGQQAGGDATAPVAFHADSDDVGQTDTGGMENAERTTTRRTTTERGSFATVISTSTSGEGKKGQDGASKKPKKSNARGKATAKRKPLGDAASSSDGLPSLVSDSKGQQQSETSRSLKNKAPNNLPQVQPPKGGTRAPKRDKP